MVNNIKLSVITFKNLSTDIQTSKLLTIPFLYDNKNIKIKKQKRACKITKFHVIQIWRYKDHRSNRKGRFDHKD